MRVGGPGIERTKVNQESVDQDGWLKYVRTLSMLLKIWATIRGTHEGKEE